MLRFAMGGCATQNHATSKELRLLFVTEPGPLIPHQTRDLLRIPLQPYPDVSAGWGILDRIRDEVVEQLEHPEIRPDSNVEAWLVTIARRKVIDHRRAGARRPVTVPLEPELASTDGLPPLADADLWAAVGSLPQRQREAVVYHHVAGLPYARIAEIADTTEAAARRAAADGIRSLRGRIAPEPERAL